MLFTVPILLLKGELGGLPQQVPCLTCLDVIFDRLRCAAKANVVGRAVPILSEKAVNAHSVETHTGLVGAIETALKEQCFLFVRMVAIRHPVHLLSSQPGALFIYTWWLGNGAVRLW